MKNFTLIPSNIIQSDEWSRISLSSQIIYWVLRLHSNGNYKAVYPGVLRIADLSGLSQPTVLKGIKELVKNNLITTKKKGMKLIFFFVRWDFMKYRNKRMIHRSFVAIENNLLFSTKWIELGTTAKMVYMWLKHEAGKDQEFKLSQEYLAKLMNVSVSSIKRALKELRDLDMIFTKLINGAGLLFRFVKSLIDPVQKVIKPRSNDANTPFKSLPKPYLNKIEQKAGITYPSEEKKEKKRTMQTFINNLIPQKVERVDTGDRLIFMRTSIYGLLVEVGITDSLNYARIQRCDSLLDLEELFSALCGIGNRLSDAYVTHLLDELEWN